MKPIYASSTYRQEIINFANEHDFAFLENKTLLISGASGMLMSYWIDALLSRPSFAVQIIALTSSGSVTNRFPADSRLRSIKGDLSKPLSSNLIPKVDYIIHAASITDPKGYKERPIETMLINIEGTKSLLDIAGRDNAKFLLVSSCEIYGEADVEPIPETYCGKLNSMDVRSCYNESKRASETLAVSYAVEKKVSVYVARLSRSYGPTMSAKDTKAMSQFIQNAVHGAPVLLKSLGDQRYSFTYVADGVSAILAILEKGKPGEAYNICGDEVLSLKEIAELVASIGGVPFH